MENEDDKMFDLNNNGNVLDSQMIDLKEDAEEDIVGLDVVDFDKKKWAYEFDINQTVGTFLDLVLQDLGIQSQNIKINFAYNSSILDNKKTLKSCGVQSLSTLYLCKEEIENKNYSPVQSQNSELDQPSGMISVIIGDTNNKMETFYIKPTATVKELIDMYQGSIHLQSKATVFLLFNGKTLKQNQTLQECGISNLSRLSIIIRLPGGL